MTSSPAPASYLCVMSSGRIRTAPCSLRSMANWIEFGNASTSSRFSASSWYSAAGNSVYPHDIIGGIKLHSDRFELWKCNSKANTIRARVVISIDSVVTCKVTPKLAYLKLWFQPSIRQLFFLLGIRLQLLYPVPFSQAFLLFVASSALFVVHTPI